jgi:hypothetical protein
MDPFTEGDMQTQLLEELENAKTGLKAHFMSNYASAGMSSFDTVSDATVANGSPQKLNARHRRKPRLADPNTELDQCFILCRFDNICGDDPLEWWHTKREVFPNLYRMVRDIFAIPGNANIIDVLLLLTSQPFRLCCCCRTCVLWRTRHDRHPSCKPKPRDYQNVDGGQGKTTNG